MLGRMNFPFLRTNTALPGIGLAVACLLFGSSDTPADEPISLIDSTDPTAGWSFDNGREFPGATGELLAAPGAGPRGEDALKLVGDFTNGGGYVQASGFVSGVSG